MDMGRAIDFRKGCYVGQELTIRTHHTGVVRKRILPVQFYTGEPSSADGPVYDPSVELSLPPHGSNINKAGGRRGRSAGKFLDGVANIGLALCRLEMMTDVALTSEGTQYTPGSEFKVSWTLESEQPAEVKLQAFIPPWTREFILAGGARKPAPRQVDLEGERARGLVEQLEEEEAQRR
jgi:mRNA-decapping enzyme subunit 2